MSTKRSIEERRAKLEQQLREQIAKLNEQAEKQAELDSVDKVLAELRLRRKQIDADIKLALQEKAEIRPPRTRSKPAAKLPAANPNVTVPKRRNRKPATVEV